MNKKGVELPQNVIIIAIIILVVLVVLIAFFAGGAGTIFGRFSDLFGKSVDDESTAVAFCQQYCQAAKDLPEVSQKNSNYCTKPFKLDRLPPKDGKADRDSTTNTLINYYCGSNNAIGDATNVVGIQCPEIKCQ